MSTNPLPLYLREAACGTQEKLPITDCQSIELSASKRRIEYEIILQESDLSGEWACMFRGLNSTKVHFEYRARFERSMLNERDELATSTAVIESTKMMTENYQSSQPLIYVYLEREWKYFSPHMILTHL